MSEQPNDGIRIPAGLLLKIIGVVVSALLGSNLWTTMTSNKELTRSQAAWDSAEWVNQRESNKAILKVLERLETELAAKP